MSKEGHILSILVDMSLGTLVNPLHQGCEDAGERAAWDQRGGAVCSVRKDSSLLSNHLGPWRVGPVSFPAHVVLSGKKPYSDF